MSRRPKASRHPSVGTREVERLADLSRLSLAPREVARLRSELSSILEYFATLDKADVPKNIVASETSPGGGQRQDVVRPSIPDEILAGVLQKKGRHVKAPRVF